MRVLQSILTLTRPAFRQNEVAVTLMKQKTYRLSGEGTTTVLVLGLKVLFPPSETVATILDRVECAIEQ